MCRVGQKTSENWHTRRRVSSPSSHTHTPCFCVHIYVVQKKKPTVEHISNHTKVKHVCVSVRLALCACLIAWVFGHGLCMRPEWWLEMHTWVCAHTKRVHTPVGWNISKYTMGMFRMWVCIHMWVCSYIHSCKITFVSVCLSPHMTYDGTTPMFYFVCMMFAMSVWVWVYFHIKLKLLGCLNVCMPIGDLNPLERLRIHIHTNLPSVSFTWLQNIQNQWDTTGRLWTSPAAQRHSHPCSFQNAQNKFQELKKQRAYCFNLHLVAAWASTSISQSNQLTISQNQLTALAQRDIEKRDLFQERRNKHTKPYLENILEFEFDGCWNYVNLMCLNSDSDTWVWLWIWTLKTQAPLLTLRWQRRRLHLKADGAVPSDKAQWCSIPTTHIQVADIQLIIHTQNPRAEAHFSLSSESDSSTSQFAARCCHDVHFNCSTICWPPDDTGVVPTWSQKGQKLSRPKGHESKSKTGAVRNQDQTTETLRVGLMIFLFAVGRKGCVITIFAGGFESLFGVAPETRCLRVAQAIGQSRCDAGIRRSHSSSELLLSGLDGATGRCGGPSSHTISSKTSLWFWVARSGFAAFSQSFFVRSMISVSMIWLLLHRQLCESSNKTATPETSKEKEPLTKHVLFQHWPHIIVLVLVVPSNLLLTKIHHKHRRHSGLGTFLQSGAHHIWVEELHGSARRSDCASAMRRSMANSLCATAFPDSKPKRLKENTTQVSLWFWMWICDTQKDSVVGCEYECEVKTKTRHQQWNTQPHWGWDSSNVRKLRPQAWCQHKWGISHSGCLKAIFKKTCGIQTPQPLTPNSKALGCWRHPPPHMSEAVNYFTLWSDQNQHIKLDSPMQWDNMFRPQPFVDIHC